ncbi:MAG: pitrilysin family protein [Cyanobacteriota bacterium]
MQSFESTTLSNGIELINKCNPNTPRTALSLYINGGNRTEKKSGVSDITTRLLLKGTKNRTAEEIALESDANAIDLDIDVKQDYSKARAHFLNDDIDIAVDLISDIIQNPTFSQFEKEIKQLSGELTLELDSPRAKATDKLIREMYPDHPYGIVSSKILETISDIYIDDVTKQFSDTFNAGNISIICVGPHKQKDLINKIEEKFSNIPSANIEERVLSSPVIQKNKVITTTKEDASQAQIIRGWYGPPVQSKDFISLLVLNNILGAAGLSSRLFIELRDKKGLAYSVRSSLEMLKYVSNFTVYIGTEPKNIETAINGFDEEIDKLIKEPVTDDELESAKKNILGKRAVYHETNAQQCFYLGIYHILGAGASYDELVPELIKKTTKDDIQHVAQKYLSQNHITSILAPSEFLTYLEREKA